MEINSSLAHFGPRNRLLLLVMRTFIFLLCTTAFALSPKLSLAQERVSINEDKQVSVDEVFAMIKEQTDYSFIYQKGMFDHLPTVQLKKGVIRVSSLLEKSLPQSDFNCIVTDGNTILIKKKSNSQQRQVSGTVADENGVPIPGVTVLIKGTTKGVATNSDGGFVIVIPDPASVLVLSALGFTDQEIMVGNQTVINVVMQESVSELDEVVLNAGYYKTSKREATGNISKVMAETIEKQPIINPIAALQGRMAGVNITQNGGVPGSGFHIQIRGTNSIRTDGNEPLYIIDGLPFSPESLGSSDLSGSTFPLSKSRTRTSNPLSSINPADIESIEILKDADATAIYGSRGANGVVLITTKKGKRGKTQFDFNMYTGFSTVSNTMNLLGTPEFLEIRREAIINDGFGSFLENPSFDSFFPELKIWSQDRYTDWQKELIGGTASTTNIQTSVSGGSDNTQFLLSFGSHNETTVFLGDFDYNKASGHLKLNHISPNRKLKLNFSTSYVSEKNNLPGIDLTRQAMRLQPNAPALYDDEGNLNWEDNTFPNPLADLEQKYLSKTNNLVVNGSFDYTVLNGLVARCNLGFNNLTLRETKETPSTRFNPSLGIGSEASTFRLNNATRQSWIIEPQLDWNAMLSKGRLNLLIGATFQERTRESSVEVGRGFPDNSLITNISAASTIEVNNSGNIDFNYNAVFGRINYNFDGKYIINFTGRRDGSSRFGPNKQFSNFWAIGTAWVFSKENLFRDNKVISFGKVRGSYGTTGSDQIPDYEFLDTYTLANNYNGQIGLAPTRLFNSDFSWEVNKKLEAGVELGFFDNRIFLNANYYRNRSSNQLIGIPLSGVTGFSSIQSNLNATVQNKGIEIELSTLNVKNKDLSWRTSLNISIPKNELITFPGLEQSEAFANTLVVGESLNIVKVYESTGVDPDTGIYTFRDFNDDGIINSEDRQVIKSLDPKYFGGLSNSISYKGFQFDFLFQFVKQIARNYYGASGSISPGLSFNIPNSLLDGIWREVGDDATDQKLLGGFSFDGLTEFGNYTISDASYSDASFIRLKNVSLSYTIPEQWTKNFKARLYLQGQNLFTITDYFGLDPENQQYLSLPPLKTISMGIQLTL